jgi:hypothetical protein
MLAVEQTLPQAPQSLALVVVSTQAPVQQVGVLPPQVVQPHEPLGGTQLAPPQLMVPVAQHMPLEVLKTEHVEPEAHVVLQAPQLLGSVV